VASGRAEQADLDCIGDIQLFEELLDEHFMGLRASIERVEVGLDGPGPRPLDQGLNCLGVVQEFAYGRSHLQGKVLRLPPVADGRSGNGEDFSEAEACVDAAGASSVEIAYSFFESGWTSGTEG